MTTSRARRPTIHDVAERAGVSKSLVSLVMRGSPNVSDEKRAAVLEAARALGYRPNAVARSLVRQRTGVLGCVVSDLHNTYFADVADGIEEAAAAAGYRALFGSAFLDVDREAMALDTLLQLQADGMIILGMVSDLAAFEPLAAQEPTVTIGREHAIPTMDSLQDDDELGADMLVDHLVGLGHRAIAHISAGAVAGGPGRRRGYEAAMRRYGLDDRIRIADGAFTGAGGAAGMTALLASGERPTAVLAPNDFAALGALAVIEEAGLRVPGDISLTGYDDIAVSGHSRISLTTVAQPAAELGARAVALLIERIEDERTEPRHEVYAPRLVVRASTGPPP